MTNYVFLANGFEEIEALTTIDVMRRAGMSVTTVSINPELNVTGAHKVVVKADALITDIDFDNANWLILPGGMPGASNLRACEPLCDALLRHNSQGRMIAAICASPTIILATLGMLNGKDATCYPGMENYEYNVNWSNSMVVVNDNIVTGRGPAAATEFALTIVSLACGKTVACDVAEGMLV